MTKQKDKVLIISSKENSSLSQELIKILNATKTNEIIAVVNINNDSDCESLAKELNIETSSSYEKYLNLTDLNVIFDITGQDRIHNEINYRKNNNTELLGMAPAKFLIEESKKVARKTEVEILDYKSIYNLVPVAIAIIDSNGMVLSLNERIDEWIGYRSEDAIGKNIFSLPFLPKSSKVAILEHFSEDLQGGDPVPYEIEFKTKSGEPRIGMVIRTLIKSKENAPDQLLVVICDITHFVKNIKEIGVAQKDAKQAQEVYRTIFENSAVSITFVDAQERIVSWNKLTEQLLGMTKDDLYLAPISSLYPEEEWRKIRSYDIRSKGGLHNVETKMIRKDKSIIDVDLSLSILKDSEGRINGSIGIVKDITQKKEGEKEILKAHKMQEDFLNMVSHEIKTPITAIQGSIGIVLDGAAGAINAEQKDFLTTAKRNLDQLDCLINDVLYYQKLEMGKAKFNLEESDINALVEKVKKKMETVVTAKGLQFNLQLDNNLPKILFDKEKIEKVLTNILDNAAKYTKQGSVTVSTALHQDVVCVAIKDTGAGIKTEDQAKLFQIFSQLSTGTRRETGNTGLGLIISKIIVEKHGGKIWVESEYGKGSTFFFILSTKK